MNIFKRMKDGGPDSPVVGYFLIEWKRVFSIALLHFGGTREAYHSHAFNAFTLWIRGMVVEYIYEDGCLRSKLWTSGDFKFTPRCLMHKIVPITPAWAITFRGPWAKTWSEYHPASKSLTTLAHGRRVVGQESQ